MNTAGTVTEIDFIQILRNDFFLGQVLFQTHTHVDFLYLTFYFFQRGICLALFFGLFLFRLHDEVVDGLHGQCGTALCKASGLYIE